MESIAHQVAETLDSLNITEKIILGGVSMGGYACFRFLDMFPDRVRALALISTRSAADTAQAREGRFKTIDMVMKEGMKSLGMKSLADRMIPNLFGKTSLQEKLPLIEKVREEIEHSFPEGVCASLRGMAERPDSSPLLPSIKCPTLILRGAEDSFIPPQEMEQMAAPIPQHEFHLIPQAGHLLNMEKPDAFKDVFLHFLKRRVL
jgi:3-oxoadipate enol-lactonase